MTDLTPYYWAVIYRSPDHPDGPLISLPMRESSAEAASDRVLSSRHISSVLSVAGPFGGPAETEAYRLSWMREQRAARQAPGPIARQRTLAALLDETTSVIFTNDLRNRPGRTPAQNAALPPVVSLYGAMNVVICGDPDDTRGERDGVNSADMVRVLSEFLAVRSPLEWSQAPERTYAEIVNALRGCASALRDAADRAEVSKSLTADPADDEVIETGPGFPVACSSVHDHDPADCAPEETTTAPETASRGVVWAITGEVFNAVGTPNPVIPETFVRVDDISALIAVHRAAGASVEVAFPFGSDGTGIPTYVHVYVGDAGTITYRRANPGESDL